jgi:hypothetical protein
MKRLADPRAVIRVDAIPPIVVRSHDHLARLAAAGGGGPAAPIVLEVPNLEPARAHELGERLTRLRSECGCAAGAKAMWGATLVVFVALVLGYGWSTGLLVRLPLVVVAAVVGAIGGKAVGIALARRAYSRELTRLLAVAPTEEV